MIERNTLFYLQEDYDYKLHKSYCRDCKQSEQEHEVIKVSDGVTDRYSDWGSGVPTIIHRCTGCGRENGPWVSANVVGGGW